MRFGSIFINLTLKLFLILGFVFAIGAKPAAAVPHNYCLDDKVSVLEIAQDQCQLLKAGVEDPNAPACAGEIKDCETLFTTLIHDHFDHFAKVGDIFLDNTDGSYIALDREDCDQVLRVDFLEQHQVFLDGSVAMVSFENEVKATQASLKASCAPIKAATQESAQNAKPTPANEVQGTGGCSLSAITSTGNPAMWLILMALPLLRSLRRQ